VAFETGAANTLPPTVVLGARPGISNVQRGLFEAQDLNAYFSFNDTRMLGRAGSLCFQVHLS